MSGLASSGERSATVMVPGFLVLSLAQSIAPAPTPALRRLLRAAAVTTLVAGVMRVSDPRCPQPGVDDEATASDVGHGAASIATFVLWTTMPAVASRSADVPVWYRRFARAATLPTLATFAGAGVTTRMDSTSKGVAQRGFLACVFLFQAATGLASHGEPAAAATPGRG